MAKEVKSVKTKAKKSTLKVSDRGRVYVSATFNNTLVTITNEKGETVGWSSAGAAGFKGARKSTPFAATTAMENVAKKQLIRV